MRRLPLVVLAMVALVLLGASPAWAQAVADQAVLTAAGEGLRAQEVYVDPTAERAISPTVADRLEASIDGGETPLFVAVLPGSAVQEAGGDPGNVPASLARATGRDGTYAVLVGDSFRAESNVLSEAGALATSTFEEFRSDGPEAVLSEFVGRVQDAAATGPAPTSAEGAGPAGDEGGDGKGGLWLLVLVGVGAGLFFWFRARRLRERETRRRETAASGSGRPGAGRPPPIARCCGPSSRCWATTSWPSSPRSHSIRTPGPTTTLGSAATGPVRRRWSTPAPMSTSSVSVG